MDRIVRFAVALLLLTGVAHAMMAPEVYRKARQSAAYHVQLAITKVDAPRQGPGGCLVEGQVLKIFKNAGDKLAPDQIIEFPVACYRRGESVPIGGTVWLDTDQLEKADYIEVYLNEDGEGFTPALWNYHIIAKVSDTAQMPVE